MKNLEWCFEGDEVEFIEDYKDLGNKTVAKIGDRAIVCTGQFSDFDHIRVDFKRKTTSLYVPTFILKIIVKNEKSRQEYILNEKCKNEKRQLLNISIGDVINLKGFSYGKTPLYKAIVTRVVDSGVYAYKVRNNGERYKGKIGEEGFYLYSSILSEKEVSEVINRNIQYESKEKRKRTI